MADQKLSALGTIVPDYLYGIAGGVSGKVIPALVLISSGTITDPVQFLDITLPIGYIQFELLLCRICFNPSDTHGIAFSQDGGVIFISDQTNRDSYSVSNVFVSSSFATIFGETQIYPSPSDGSVGGANLRFMIDPGDATTFPNIQCVGVSTGALFGETPAQNGFGDAATLYNNATVPPVYQRMTTLRYAPHGSGDIDPPTSGNTITDGTWLLFGVPT